MSEASINSSSAMSVFNLLSPSVLSPHVVDLVSETPASSSDIVDLVSNPAESFTEVVDLVSEPSTPTPSFQLPEKQNGSFPMAIYNLISPTSSSDHVINCQSQVQTQCSERNLDQASSLYSSAVLPILNSYHSSIPLAPTSSTTHYVTSLLQRDISTGLLRITPKLKARYVWAPEKLPKYLPCAPDGYATVISIAKSGPLCTDDLGRQISLRAVSDRSFSDRLYSGVPYSFSMKGEGTSTVYLAGSNLRVSRRRALCSGVKSCSCSMSINSVSHCGYQDDHEPQIPIPELSTNTSEEEKLKARDLFFYAQANFPLTCKHIGTISSSNVRSASRFSRQTRVPNWNLKHGFLIQSPDGCGSSVRLPDIVDCSEFGSPGLHQRNCCDYLILPDHLQGTNMYLVNQLIQHATEGAFPIQPRYAMNKCPPLPVMFGGKDCHQGIHGYEAVPVSVIPCSARYQYLIHKSDGKPDWAVIIGYGSHTHVPPLPRPSPSQTSRVVRSLMKSNANVTAHQICDHLVEQYGCRPSLPSVRRVRFNTRSARQPKGRTLDAIHASLRMRSNTDRKLYVRKIIDQRDQDTRLRRADRDQVGVVIVMSNEELMVRAVAHPHMGCDGTFNVVSKSADEIDYELVSILCQDVVTKRMFCPMRVLSSRKTVASRKILFTELFIALKRCGLTDPLDASPEKRLTISTDFETTFAIALGSSLAEVFRPDEDMANVSSLYVQAVCFGCSVHAKRIVLEKVDKENNARLYNWVVGTRSLSTEVEVKDALARMKILNSKLHHFAKWLETNFVARILWFWRRYKDVTDGVQRRVLWSTNANESMHAMLKSAQEYVLTRTKGMDLVTFVQYLERLDENEVLNLSGKLGVPHGATPLLNRKRKKRKASSEAYVEVDGNLVLVSQPKRAKRR